MGVVAVDVHVGEFPALIRGVDGRGVGGRGPRSGGTPEAAVTQNLLDAVPKDGDQIERAALDPGIESENRTNFVLPASRRTSIMLKFSNTVQRKCGLCCSSPGQSKAGRRPDARHRPGDVRGDDSAWLERKEGTIPDTQAGVATRARTVSLYCGGSGPG